MKDETKGIGLGVITLGVGLIIGMVIGVNSKIRALDKKVESIFYFTKEVRLTLFEDTCHKQGGIYSETKEGGRCDKIEAYKPRGEFKEFKCPEDTSKPVGFVGTPGQSEESMETEWKRLQGQLEKCRKWKEAQDVLRKKNYKEYACKTLDTFEDYLACNEK